MQNVCTPKDTQSTLDGSITLTGTSSSMNIQKKEVSSWNNSDSNLAAILSENPRKKYPEANENNQSVGKLNLPVDIVSQAFHITFKHYPIEVLTMEEAALIKKFISDVMGGNKSIKWSLTDVTLGPTLSGAISIVTHNTRIRNVLRFVVENLDFKPSKEQRRIHNLALVSVNDFKPARTIIVKGFKGLKSFPLDSIKSKIEESFKEQPGYLWHNNSRAMFTVTEKTWNRIRTARPPLRFHSWEGDFVLHKVDTES